jgi:serine protease Do
VTRPAGIHRRLRELAGRAAYLLDLRLSCDVVRELLQQRLDKGSAAAGQVRSALSLSHHEDTPVLQVQESRRGHAVAILAGSLLLGCAIPAAAQPKPVPTQDPLVRMNESVDQLTRKVWPSVVQVVVTGYGAREEGLRTDTNVVVGPQRSTGSGFVIDADGYIMTNAHVVSNARRVQIVMPAEKPDGTIATALTSRTRVLNARIVGLAAELDLAVLKVDGEKLPALPLATYSQLRQGETVFAFGSPIGLRNSLTHGLVSAVARQIDPDSPLIFIQTDAPINPGNSGGPLVNIRGEVVGVNTFIMSQSGGNDGLGFAVPSATARTAFRQLRQHGQLRRQEVGMSLQTITPAMAQALSLQRDYGVIVSDVWPGGPAESAGLKIGDVLISVDGQPADNLPSVNYQFRLRESTDNAEVVVLRGLSEQRLSVPVVEQRSPFDALTASVDPTQNMVSALGIIGVELTPEMASGATGLRDPYGVVVVARTSGAASEVPLLPRDVIRSANHVRIGTLQELRQAIGALAPGTAVTLQIQRDARLMFITFTID